MTPRCLLPMVASREKEAVMSDTKPIITFHVELKTDVTPDALYAVLADLSTHVIWAGTEAPREDFRLLTIEAPAGSAVVGSTFSSSGANGRKGDKVSHDHSTVVEAVPGKRFGFDTEAAMERKHKEAWRAHFEHRYSIEPTGTGSTITYDGKAYPENYRPYWLFPTMRPMIRALVHIYHRKHMQNLARLAQNARL